MRTVSASAHVISLAQDLLSKQGAPALTEEQAAAVTTAVERLYGVALDLPSAEEMAQLLHDRR